MPQLGGSYRTPSLSGISTFAHRWSFALSTLTKNQHYVWQHHLKSWSNRNKLYCYRQAAKKLFETRTNAIANETYFYRSDRLTEMDLQYINGVIAKATASELRDLHRGTVRMFQLTFLLRDQLAALGLSESKRRALEKQLEESEKTLGEKFHTFVEGGQSGY
jgi:hypothetical protein